MFVLFGNYLSAWWAGLILLGEVVLVHVATIGHGHCHAIRAIGYSSVLAMLLLCPSTGSYYQYNLLWIWNSYTSLHMWQNIIIFLPLGYYWYLTNDRFWCIVVLLILGVGLELLQLLVPGRVCDIMDIVGNSIGSVLGALVAVAVSHIGGRHDIQDKGRV